MSYESLVLVNVFWFDTGWSAAPVLSQMVTSPIYECSCQVSLVEQFLNVFAKIIRLFVIV